MEKAREMTEKDVKKNILRSIYHSLKFELNHFYHVYIKPVYRTPIIVENMQAISVDEILDKGERKLEQNLVLPDVSLRTKKITIWEERWLEICQLGNEKNNFKTIVTIQPVLGTGNKPLIEEESERLFKESERQFLLLETLAGFAETLNKLEKTCIKTVDLRNVFDNTPEPIYFDGDKAWQAQGGNGQSAVSYGKCLRWLAPYGNTFQF